MGFNVSSHICGYDTSSSKFDFRVLSSRSRLTWLKYFLLCKILSLQTWTSEFLQYCTLMSRSYMTFTLRSQAFCFFIHIIIICHDILQFRVCPHQVVLCDGICIACDALLCLWTPKVPWKWPMEAHLDYCCPHVIQTSICSGPWLYVIIDHQRTEEFA